MGILLNEGVQKRTVRMARLHFASNTPYETIMEPKDSAGTRVVPRAVARAILPVLAQVVQSGTAVRLSGALKVGDKPLLVGGKTGSGDNRFETVGHGGQILSSRPVDRTAVFVFYIEDRYFGVITVFVPGKEAGDYGFTSSLPVAILKLLAPNIEALWLPPPPSASPAILKVASHPPAQRTPNGWNPAVGTTLQAAKSATLALESTSKRPVSASMAR
jgi:hypothetical protein